MAKAFPFASASIIDDHDVAALFVNAAGEAFFANDDSALLGIARGKGKAARSLDHNGISFVCLTRVHVSSQF